MTTPNDDPTPESAPEPGAANEEPDFDPFEAAAAALGKADVPDRVIQEVENAHRLGDVLTARRLRLITEEDPEGAAKIQAALETEKAREAEKAAEQARQEALTEEQREAERLRQEGASEREVRKQQLAQERARERAAKEAEERQAALDAEILAELDSETTTDAPDEFETQRQVVAESVARIQELKSKPFLTGEEFDELGELADQGLEAARVLETGSPENPIDFDPDDFLMEFNASQKEAE